jgi:signal peptidase II
MPLTLKKLLPFLTVALIAIIADQSVKQVILGGYRWESKCLSIVFVLNDGVAFSMFAFLQGYLKYIQIALISFALYYVYVQKYIYEYRTELGLILGSGISNVVDRFVHGGVVDYVYWHCGFNFAVFNLADVLIDVGVGLLLLKTLVLNKK